MSSVAKAAKGEHTPLPSRSLNLVVFGIPAFKNQPGVPLEAAEPSQSGSKKREMKLAALVLPPVLPEGAPASLPPPAPAPVAAPLVCDNLRPAVTTDTVPPRNAACGHRPLSTSTGNTVGGDAGGDGGIGGNAGGIGENGGDGDGMTENVRSSDAMPDPQSTPQVCVPSGGAASTFAVGRMAKPRHWPSLSRSADPVTSGALIIA
eukprot:7382156-Prymnesium_polylepis.1